MAWRVELLDGARKTLSRLDPPEARRILAFLKDRVATDDDPRRLGGPLVARFAGHWRYRVGEYRLICRIEDARLLVLVLTIGHRREVYR